MGHILLNSVKRFGSLENYVYLCANKTYKAYSMKEIDKFVDLSGAELKLGDFVAFYHSRYKTRVGKVCGFTSKQVRIQFHMMETYIDEEHFYTFSEVNIYPWRCVRVYTQEELYRQRVINPTESVDGEVLDINFTELKVGDKVGVYYAQEYRIGVVSGFTKNRVIVDFDFGVMSEQIDHVRLDHSKLAKIYNQDCNVKETWKNDMSLQG